MEAHDKNQLAITSTSGLTRLKERGHYDRETINSILDDGILCHIGFEDKGKQIVLPNAYVRRGDEIIIHGAVNGRFHQRLAEGIPSCVTVSYLDGLVLARSAFHHSVNYRCVMIFGSFSPLESLEEKRAALDAFIDGCIPGRSKDNIRAASDKELHATAVLTMKITEASAKIRTGPPKDDKKDMSLPVWAGVIEKQPSSNTIITDSACIDSIEAPPYLDAVNF